MYIYLSVYTLTILYVKTQIKELKKGNERDEENRKQKTEMYYVLSSLNSLMEKAVSNEKYSTNDRSFSSAFYF